MVDHVQEQCPLEAKFLKRKIYMLTLIAGYIIYFNNFLAFSKFQTTLPFQYIKYRYMHLTPTLEFQNKEKGECCIYKLSYSRQVHGIVTYYVYWFQTYFQVF